MDVRMIEDVMAALRDHLEATNEAIEAAAKDAIRAVMKRQEDAPDYCFNADDWEITYPWSDRDELTMNLSPGDWVEVSRLKQISTKWAACIVRADDWETLWFDRAEDAEKAVASWRAALRRQA